MIGSYLEEHEKEQLNELLKHDDTISGWIMSRLKGVSASMAFDGNISTELLKQLDETISQVADEQDVKVDELTNEVEELKQKVKLNEPENI